MTVWLEIIAFRPLSLAPPTTPCLARCAFIQLCIQPHPRLIPPSALIIIFPPRVTSLRRCLFLRNPSTDDNERRNKESRKLDRPASISPPPPLPLVAKSGLTRLFLRKIRPQGRGRGKRDRWPPFVLVEVEATVNEKRRICIDPIQEFTFSLFFVSDGRWSFSVRDSKCWSRR